MDKSLSSVLAKTAMSPSVPTGDAAVQDILSQVSTMWAARGGNPERLAKKLPAVEEHIRTLSLCHTVHGTLNEKDAYDMSCCIDGLETGFVELLAEDLDQGASQLRPRILRKTNELASRVLGDKVKGYSTAVQWLAQQPIAGALYMDYASTYLYDTLGLLAPETGQPVEWKPHKRLGAPEIRAAITENRLGMSVPKFVPFRAEWPGVVPLTTTTTITARAPLTITTPAPPRWPGIVPMTTPAYPGFLLFASVGQRVEAPRSTPVSYTTLPQLIDFESTVSTVLPPRPVAAKLVTRKARKNNSGVAVGSRVKDVQPLSECSNNGKIDETATVLQTVQEQTRCTQNEGLVAHAKHVQSITGFDLRDLERVCANW